MMSLTNLTPTIHPGAFVVPAGAELRGVANDDALAEVWEETQRCFGYSKPDGWRIQIHKMGSDVFLFSRSGKDWTAEFPALVSMLRERIQDDAILDTELVGFDEYGAHLGPSKLLTASQYHCYLLDALYLHGQSLVDMPTRERIPFILEYLSDALYGTFTLIDYTPVESESDLIRFYHQCRTRQKEGFDGMIIKQLHTPYFTDVFKVKPEETIDAVVVGAYRDREKQGEIKTLLLAVPSHKRNSWVPIGKVAQKGTESAVWSACKEYILRQRPEYLEEPPTRPHIWVAPEVVVTINTTSLGPGTGYRIHAFAARNCVLRVDKSPKEATSFEQLLQMAHLDEAPEPIKRAERSRQWQPSLF
jgi:ATP-dependent DNA ligase